MKRHGSQNIVRPGTGNRPVVALATCAAVAGSVEEDLGVIAALQRRGIEAAHVAWDDPGVDWSSFRLVLVRSTWDYPHRRAAFLAWAESLPTVLNPASVLRWNTDKRYLEQLAEAGLPVIPTRFLEPGDAFAVPPAPFVIKPAISCSAKDTARYTPGDAETAREHVHRLQQRGRTVMVQPYLRDIEAEGEVAVVFLGGVYSHAIRRAASLQEGRPSGTGLSLPLDVRAHAATPAERRLAERVLGQAPGGPSGLLYSRVDLIPGLDGGPVVLEVELTEPTLFLAYSQGGEDKLAESIAFALSRL